MQAGVRKFNLFLPGGHGDGCMDSTLRSSNAMANRQVYNPYCDPMRLGLREHGTTPQKCTSSQYPASMGDYDYTEIDNLDTSAAGEFSLSLHSVGESEGPLGCAEESWE